MERNIRITFKLALLACLVSNSLFAQIGNVVQSFPSPENRPTGLTWDGKYLWCTDRDKNEIYLIDTLRQSVFQIINAPGTYSYGLAHDGEFVWNVDYNTDTIYKIQFTATDKYKLYDSLKVKIRYSVNIKNAGSSSMDLETYIACPIDLLYQKLDSTLDFKETPESCFFDKYGQEIAYYHDIVPVGVERNYQYSVPVTLQNIRYFHHPDSVGYLSDIPQSVRDFYTTDEEMYLITNPAIVGAVQEALGDETNFYWQVRKIHDYVIDHVEYLSEGGWDAAPVVLARGTGSCSEYTYLFIAMCRAAGIPARFEAGGHLRDTIPYEDKIFHRWAQVYFPDLEWLPIDCTWDDKEYPCNQARYFGARSTKVFTTTIGAGGDDGLWWTYNSANSNSGGERERQKMMEWLDYSTCTQIKPIIAPQNLITALNYPNPFSNISTIEYRVSEPSVVKIYIYTNLGKLVRIFDEGFIDSVGSLIWNGKNAHGTEMNNGIYYYKIKGGINSFTGRMILIK